MENKSKSSRTKYDLTYKFFLLLDCCVGAFLAFLQSILFISLESHLILNDVLGLEESSLALSVLLDRLLDDELFEPELVILGLRDPLLWGNNLI